MVDDEMTPEQVDKELRDTIKTIEALETELMHRRHFQRRARDVGIEFAAELRQKLGNKSNWPPWRTTRQYLKQQLKEEGRK